MSATAPIDPDYVAELERRPVATEAEFAHVTAQNALLEASNASLAEANARLERMLAQARHARFGPSSEKGDPDQRNLFTEDIEVAEGQLAAAADAADKALGKTPRSKTPAKRSWPLRRHGFKPNGRRQSARPSRTRGRAHRTREHALVAIESAIGPSDNGDAVAVR